MSLARRFIHEEDAEDLVEYGLLAAFAATIATAAVIGDPLSVKPALVKAFRRAKNALADS